ncbi:hypothetical protein ACHQM5_015590 [Ranunculus cassubicifolius]
MGGSSSTPQISHEQQELESLATSTGALSILQKAFEKLSDPLSKSIPLKSLRECFHLSIGDPISETSLVPDCFPKLLLDLGPSIVDLYFVADKEEVDWIQFLRGYIKCCGRVPTSESINNMCRLYAATSTKAGFPTKIEFESEDTDCKISGYFTSSEVLMFLWICWIMSQSSEKASRGKVELEIPDTNHLLLSAVTSCSEDVKDLNIWDCSPSDLKVQLPAQKLHMWILSTIPSISHCLVQYLNARLHRCAALEDDMDLSSLAISVTESPNKQLLTCGRAWSVSLTLRGTLSEEILKACIPEKVDETSHNLLYQSTLHGRGLNRFWSNVEGYNGPILILVSASSKIDDGTSTIGKWVIGILTGQGFENKDVFYGSSGYLYAISPVFHAFPHHGKDKNFVYSHLHISGRVYDPHPKPVGIGFGGSIGNERISIDEDFSKVTIRHHAVDKTYQSGPLIPNQGFLPLEAPILDVEVWGLSGEMAKKEQNAYKNREQLFTDQRRKVDLKTFGNWEDSPEKMMMDMVSDPNRVRREER